MLIIIGLGEDQSLVWVEGDAEALSFGNDSMDGYTIAFGIRNVTHIEKVLSEAYRYKSQFFPWLSIYLNINFTIQGKASFIKFWYSPI